MKRPIILCALLPGTLQGIYVGGIRVHITVLDATQDNIAAGQSVRGEVLCLALHIESGVECGNGKEQSE